MPPSGSLRLEFLDFVDLQTRLVLLPRIEDEGRGAIVASYAPKQLTKNDGDNVYCGKESNNVIIEEYSEEFKSQNVMPIEIVTPKHQSENEVSPGNISPVTETSPMGNSDQQHSQKNEEEAAELVSKESEDVDAVSIPTAERAGESLNTDPSLTSRSASQMLTEAQDMNLVEPTDHIGMKDSNVTPEVDLEEPKQHNALECEEEPERESDHRKTNGNNKNEAVIEKEAILGKMLVGISNGDNNDMSEDDFADILTAIREAPTPIVLLFEEPPFSIGEEEQSLDELYSQASLKENQMEEDDDSTSSSTTGSQGDSDHEGNDPAKSEDLPRNMLQGKLSSWKSRFAAEAAPAFASLSSAASRAAAEVSDRAAKARSEHKGKSTALADDSSTKEERPCGLFLQCSGEFIPLDLGAKAASPNKSTTNPNPEVTNSSILVIRGTAQPGTARNFNFQWYRSINQGGSDSKDNNIYLDSSQNEVEWAMLVGATHPTFQPSATDIGHRVRCAVTVVANSDVEDGDPDEKDTEARVICELQDTISADISLFNAARQALLQGAQFGNLEGVGNSAGRSFKVSFEILFSRSKSKKNETESSSAMTIYQICGTTTEASNDFDDRILNASALSDPAQPKQFDLVFPEGLPRSITMISDISTDDGRFQLEAPNRITRETLLLALGIANFKGRPADLNATTILYPSCRVSPISIETDCSSGDSVDSERVLTSVHPEAELHSCSSDERSERRQAEDDKMQELEVELERDLQNMRSKLAKKDKAVSKIQKQLAQSESKLNKSENELSSCHEDLKESNNTLKLAEKRIRTHEDTIVRLKKDHMAHSSASEGRINEHSVTLAEMEKFVRSLQNEKAVLVAAVDARDSRLSKMATLQTAVDSLTIEASKKGACQADLNEANIKQNNLRSELSKVLKSEKACCNELGKARETVTEMKESVADESKRTKACQSQVDMLQAQTQKIKAERNNCRQKSDSLSKEVARICKNGMTLRDVEKVVQDDIARRTEVSLLREQKRKAMEDLDLYRTMFDQSLEAQRKAGINGEAVRALEQNLVLERVVADLTEYVSAKEMQLDTMTQINHALQEELHQLAMKKTFEKNDI